MRRTCKHFFSITESAHRIHNPITPATLATRGAARRLESGDQEFDLGSGLAEMGCTWARDHGVIDTLRWFLLIKTAGAGMRQPNAPLPILTDKNILELHQIRL